MTTVPVSTPHTATILPFKAPEDAESKADADKQPRLRHSRSSALCGKSSINFGADVPYHL